jgi:hypothetical protein
LFLDEGIRKGDEEDEEEDDDDDDEVEEEDEDVRLGDQDARQS